MIIEYSKRTKLLRISWSDVLRGEDNEYINVDCIGTFLKIYRSTDKWFKYVETATDDIYTNCLEGSDTYNIFKKLYDRYQERDAARAAAAQAQGIAYKKSDYEKIPYVYKAPEGTSKLVMQKDSGYTPFIFIARRNKRDKESANCVFISNKEREEFFKDSKIAKNSDRLHVVNCPKYCLSKHDPELFNKWERIFHPKYRRTQLMTESRKNEN